MIYIFSKDGDYTTNDVIDWLEYYQEEYQRINHNESEDKILELSTKLQSHTSYISNIPGKYSTKKNVFWFRRPDGQLLRRLVGLNKLNEDDISYPKFPKNSEYWASLENNYKWHQIKYYKSILNDQEYVIGPLNPAKLNKLDVLKKASKLGIDIPSSLVSNSKKDLKDFFEIHNRNLICKSLFEVILPKDVEKSGFLLRCLTTSVKDLNEVPDAFFPTLFQENISKLYEIRSYYIDGQIYSAAMFTQSDDQTVQDFRNYNKMKPSRVVRYQLDKDLEDKIRLLMTSLDLNNGSIDIMKGVDKKYYFLEINPVGQYGFISKTTNYNIDKINAEALIKKQYSIQN